MFLPPELELPVAILPVIYVGEYKVSSKIQLKKRSPNRWPDPAYVLELSAAVIVHEFPLVAVETFNCLLVGMLVDPEAAHANVPVPLAVNT